MAHSCYVIGVRGGALITDRFAHHTNFQKYCWFITIKYESWGTNWKIKSTADLCEIKNYRQLHLTHITRHSTAFRFTLNNNLTYLGRLTFGTELKKA